MAGSVARILVADDEASQRYLFWQYSGAAGVQVVEAADGHEAQVKIDAGQVDAALVDIMMPGMDGFEVVPSARRHSAIPGQPPSGRGPNRRRASVPLPRGDRRCRGAAVFAARSSG